MSTKYDREKLIGSGTFGNVWLVRSRCSGLRYVLKEVQLKSMNPAERQQALTEVTVLSTCRHRNIIRYKEASISYERGVLSIAMEYADGGDLYTLIRRQKGCYFDEKDVLSWFVQITFALQYIHSRNILHRDLKSKNIFLTKEKVVKVGDFGIARVLAEDGELATTAIGTPYYLSPEICQRKSYNHKSDMWALGCVLFEMSALFHPFQAQNFHQLVSAILQVKYQALPNHCSDLVKDLISVLLCEDPDERPLADEVLSIPALLPYFRKYCGSIPEGHTISDKSNHFKLTSRRFSSNDVIKDARETENFKRRASMSVRDHSVFKTPKTPLNKDRVAPRKTSSNSSPKLTSAKTNVGKTSPLTNIMNMKHGDIHRRQSSHSNSPVTSKDDDSTPNATYILVKSHHENCPVRRYAEMKKDNHSRDRVHTPKMDIRASSEKTDAQIKVRDGLPEVRASPKSSCNSNGNDSVFDDAEEGSAARSLSSTRPVEDRRICPHVSQCRQCMVDKMWKNRIRMDSSLHLDHSERHKLRVELQSVFGTEKFHRMYGALTSEWDGCEDPTSLHRLFQSLDTEQGQYVPLLLQLVQVDLLSKTRVFLP